MSALKDAGRKRSGRSPPLLDEDGAPGAEISLGAVARWAWLRAFPCYDGDEFRRQKRMRRDLGVGQPPCTTVRRACQSGRHRCCWLCCSVFGPLLIALPVALCLFYFAYLPAVSHQHPPLYDTNGVRIQARAQIHLL